VPALPQAAETVLTFLESVGRRSEAELYWKLFRQLPKEGFAIIAAEVAGVRDAMGLLAEQLHYLSALGLVAPVVLGLIDPAGADREAQRLGDRLAALGLSCCAHEASAVDLADRLRAQLQQETIPVVLFRQVEGGADRRFAILGDLASALNSRKLVVVRRRGGLGPSDRASIDLGSGPPLPCHEGGISVINLMTDAIPLRESRLLGDEDSQLLERVEGILRRADLGRLLVNVTSPLTMLTDLFTVRGAGTLIKRGTTIERHKDYGTVDLPRLRGLLEASFGRPLMSGFFARAPLAVYLQPDYRGAAIVEPSPAGPLLSKFAVDPVAQGEGMGRDLWQALVRDFDCLLWRARLDNPINGFYLSECDGMLRTERWQLFWRRVPPSRVAEVAAELTGRPGDFVGS
jgi:acetylglutamate kinase